MPSKDAKQQVKREKQSGTPLLEWLSAAVGALVTIGLLTLLSIEALRTRDGSPPVLDVRPVAIAQRGGLYIVELRVANLTGHTAAAVAIEGELKQGAQSLEKSSATVSFVPGHSQRRAGLIFSRDPRRFQFAVRATGYEGP